MFSFPNLFCEYALIIILCMTNEGWTMTMSTFKRNFLIACIATAVTIVFLIYQYGIYLGCFKQEQLLSLPHCKIPEISIFSNRYQYQRIKFGSCDEEYKFSFVENGILRLENIGPNSKCCAAEIVRPSELPSDGFIKRQCIPFNDSKTMEVTGKEFIRVSCTDIRSSSLTRRANFHANVIPSADYLKQKIEYWKHKEMPVNVLVIVLDSTSRTDAFRHLPKTMDYLLNELNFVDFKGFHHLGEPTMFNAIPLLLGLPYPEFSKTHTFTSYWDNLPFIWQDFSQSNYATAYIEDIPIVGTFNYGGQRGFTFKPTDFYLRPFFLAAGIKSGIKQCVGKSPIPKFIMDYQLEMLKKMKGIVPVFSMPWICWPQHDYAGSLYHLENTILEFFQNVNNEPGLLENTVIIVMADHGFYIGPYAQSHEGLLERRLPLFLIRLPGKLNAKHPEFADRVQENSRRIASHYDVYKTLLSLAQLAAPGTNPVFKNNMQQFERNFGKSLFDYIPENRTCSEAGIPKRSCACNLPPPSVDWIHTVPNIMKLK